MPVKFKPYSMKKNQPINKSLKKETTSKIQSHPIKACPQTYTSTATVCLDFTVSS
jgi:hypothetical protein